MVGIHRFIGDLQNARINSKLLIHSHPAPPPGFASAAATGMYENDCEAYTLVCVGTFFFLGVRSFRVPHEQGGKHTQHPVLILLKIFRPKTKTTSPAHNKSIRPPLVTDKRNTNLGMKPLLSSLPFHLLSRPSPGECLLIP